MPELDLGGISEWHAQQAINKKELLSKLEKRSERENAAIWKQVKDLIRRTKDEINFHKRAAEIVREAQYDYGRH